MSQLYENKITVGDVQSFFIRLKFLRYRLGKPTRYTTSLRLVHLN